MKFKGKYLFNPFSGNKRHRISQTLYCLVIVLLFINTSFATDTTGIVRYLEYNDSELFSKEMLDSLIGKNKYLALPEIKELKLSLAPLEPGDGFAYIYQLHGFDQKTDTSKNSEIRYTNIPGGRYKLEITACRNNEVLGVYELPFSVFNPIHRQWWFGPLLTFCFLMIPIAIFYFFNLDRSRRVLRLESVRNQIASDLHDDIGANLSAIKNFTEIIEKKTPENSASASLIRKTKDYLSQTMSGLQDTVWSINPLNDSVELLIEKMQEFAILMLSAKEIELKIENLFDKKFPIILDMDQRHNLLLIFKEVINNIVKHSCAKNVKIRIASNREALHLTVKDDGKGFDSHEKFQGNGLRNFKTRSRQHFIETEITSAPGKGTEVQITAYSL